MKAREKSDATVERKPDSSETRIVTIHSSQNEDFQHKIPSLPQHLVIEGVADNCATMLNKLRTSPLDAGLHYEYGIQCVQSRDKSSALEQYDVLLKLDTNLAKELFDQIYPSA